MTDLFSLVPSQVAVGKWQIICDIKTYSVARSHQVTVCLVLPKRKGAAAVMLGREDRVEPDEVETAVAAIVRRVKGDIDRMIDQELLSSGFQLPTDRAKL